MKRLYRLQDRGADRLEAFPSWAKQMPFNLYWQFRASINSHRQGRWLVVFPHQESWLREIVFEELTA